MVTYVQKSTDITRKQSIRGIRKINDFAINFQKESDFGQGNILRNGGRIFIVKAYKEVSEVELRIYKFNHKNIISLIGR